MCSNGNRSLLNSLCMLGVSPFFPFFPFFPFVSFVSFVPLWFKRIPFKAMRQRQGQR